MSTPSPNPPHNAAAEALIRKLRSQKWTDSYKEGAEILTILCEYWEKHGKHKAGETSHEFKEGQAVCHRKEYVAPVKGKLVVKKTTCDTVKFLTSHRDWAVVVSWSFRVTQHPRQVPEPYCVPLQEIFSIPESPEYCPECKHLKVVGTFKTMPGEPSTQPFRLERTIDDSVIVGPYFDTEEEARAVGCGTGFEIKERETQSYVMKVQGRYSTPDGKVHIDFGITDQGLFVASGHFNGKSGQCIEEIEASPYGAHREIAQLAQNWRFDHLKKANQKLTDWCIKFAAKHPL